MRTRLISLASAALVVGCSVTAGFGASKFPDRQIEIGLWGGSSPIRILGTASVQDSWSSFLLKSVTEQTVIQTKVKPSVVAGGYFSIFLSPHFGVEVLAGNGQTGLTTGSTFDFAWTWTDGTGTAARAAWSRTGRLTRIPVCLNLVFKEASGSLALEASGGLAYYWNSLRAESVFGYGITKITFPSQTAPGTMTQSIDALPVRLTIPNTSWTAAGADVGASLSVRLTDAVGLRAEARYFYCPPKRFTWTPALGTYDGLFGDAIRQEPFTADDIAYLNGIRQKFDEKIELSFIQFSVGITFFLGRALRH